MKALIILVLLILFILLSILLFRAFFPVSSVQLEHDDASGKELCCIERTEPEEGIEKAPNLLEEVGESAGYT